MPVTAFAGLKPNIDSIGSIGPTLVEPLLQRLPLLSFSRPVKVVLLQSGGAGHQSGGSVIETAEFVIKVSLLCRQEKGENAG